MGLEKEKEIEKKRKDTHLYRELIRRLCYCLGERHGMKNAEGYSGVLLKYRSVI